MAFDKDDIDTVYYHGNCFDGFGSAFVVWHWYQNKSKNINYIPCHYSKKELNLEDYQDKNVLMCDFTFDLDQMQEILSKAKSFLVLDHHKTAKEILSAFPDKNKIFDMDRSGAGITWDYFYPQESMPLFLRLIQDRDLWLFKFPQTKAFTLFLLEQDMTFEFYRTFLDEDNLNSAVTQGQHWLNYQTLLIHLICKCADVVSCTIRDKTYTCAIVNTPEFKSEVGSTLFEHYPEVDFTAMWNYDIIDDKTYYSLRSLKHGADVSYIASCFGGGGHYCASGFDLNGRISLPFSDMERTDTLHNVVGYKCGIAVDYRKLVIEKICKRARLVLHKQDKDYKLVLYINFPFIENSFVEDINNTAHEMYPWLDDAIVWYGSLNNTTPPLYKKRIETKELVKDLIKQGKAQTSNIPQKHYDDIYEFLKGKNLLQEDS